ncbi:MAG TPA: hypothetical protein VFY29_18735 [Terriglobia bacterium]|nr:hypothetical protein [Terriglobia bacterium]
MKKSYAILAILLVAAPLAAVTPSFWEVRTWEEFQKGHFDGVSLTREGELILAPRFDPVFNTEQPFVFSAVADSKGNVYLGTGHDGKVYKVNPSGVGEVVADLAELDVLALAVDAKDTLYAASSPDGKIYKIEPGASPQVFFDPKAKYIWSLIFDREGRLLAGTGDKGVIYRIDSNGKGAPFYDTDETNVVSLAMGNDGYLIAGGDPKGYVYRISPAGKAFVLFDSGMRETHALAIGPNGSVYAAMVNGSGASGSSDQGAARTSSSGVDSGAAASPASTVPLAAQRVEVTVESVEVISSADEGPRGTPARSAGVSGMIIEIRPDGVVNTLWRGEEMVYSLLPRDGKLLFSTGSKGRIYSLTGPRDTTLLVESTEEQTTRLLEAAGKVYAASASAGKLFHLSDTPGRTGTYESTVHDAGAVSSWGRVSWKAQQAGLIEVQTRSGNTGTPDKTWSDWTRVGADGTVSSPKARFIQWKATLKSEGQRSAALDAVMLAYLAPNLQPEVTSIETLPEGIALAKPATSAGTAPVNELGVARASIRAGQPVQRPSPRRVNQKGAQAFQWTAVDGNQDLLRYDLYYREVSDRAWKPLKMGIDDSFFTVESDTLPDGMYVLRVIASDLLSNPAGSALSGEMESRPFIVDNTPPDVRMRELGDGPSGSARIGIEASDATSVLVDAQVAIDAGEWRPVFPNDGILDSKSESFTYVTGGLAPGDHVIAFRVYDQTDNIGIAKIVVTIP